MPPKKGKPPTVNLAEKLKGKKDKPKKPPPPPACFKQEELMKFKETYKLFDTDDIDLVKLTQIPTMLRHMGFNPKGEEIADITKRFMEDEFQDMVELWQWYFMIEAKKNMGDDVEHDVTLAFGFLGHDNEEKPTEIVQLDVLFEELQKWGEPLSDLELADWPRAALKEKSYSYETGELQYVKFIDAMNAKDTRFLPEPINYFKLDQRQLAALAMAKAAEEREEIKRREQDRRAREEAKRQRMIDTGAIQPGDIANLPKLPDYKEPPNPFDILAQGL